VNVLELTEPPAEWLGEALARFELQFRYPLGPTRSFRISHGGDYVTFFQAIGEARTFVCERRGTVLGTLSAVTRNVRFPSGETRRAAYLCDLKVAPRARGGRTLLHLMNAVRARLDVPCSGLAYAVVMDGTARTPAAYTGQLSLPAFEKLDELMVLRIPTQRAGTSDDRVHATTAGGVQSIHDRLMRGQFVPLGGVPATRSQVEPAYLELTDGCACGVLEDTRRGKRLFDDAGDELLSAHLSRFAYASTSDAARFLARVLGLAKEAGFPALFTAIPRCDTAKIVDGLTVADTLLAPATVFGCSFRERAAWRIDTSEI
jgi:hypothetical protein